MRFALGAPLRDREADVRDSTLFKVPFLKFLSDLSNFFSRSRSTLGRNIHSLSSGKDEMFLCTACHASTPHLNAWKN